MRKFAFYAAIFCVRILAPRRKGHFEKNRHYVVYITFQAIDQDSINSGTVYATGIVISPKWYVLISSNVLRDWINYRSLGGRRLPIQAYLEYRPGYTRYASLNVDVVNPGNPEFGGVALLKLPEPSAGDDYKSAVVCNASANLGEKFNVVGFPWGDSFSVKSNSLQSKEAVGGNWVAENRFDVGMVPIYNSRCNIVGFVRGSSQIPTKCSS